MNCGRHTEVVTLLTVSLGKPDRSAVKSLSRTEWTRFSKWLKEHDLVPSDLLKGDLIDPLSGWADRSIALSRIEGLLDTTTKQAAGLVKAQAFDSASTESRMETTGANAVDSEDTSNRVDDFYALFQNKMREFTGELPLASLEISSRLNLKKVQVDAWLKRGVRDGHIARSTRPVRYRSSEGKQQKSFAFNESIK